MQSKLIPTKSVGVDWTSQFKNESNTNITTSKLSPLYSRVRLNEFQRDKDVQKI